jgi:hypothetical protein
MPRLENWYLFAGDKLVGNVYDDEQKRFEDGEQIRTSTVTEMGEGFAQTRNTRYTLGQPYDWTKDEPTD